MTQDDSKTIRSARARLRRGFLFAGGAFLVLLIGAYLKILADPIPVPYFRSKAMEIARDHLPETLTAEIGTAVLAFENFYRPVARFSPVRLRDSATGADVRMEALSVGISPFRALIGQPAATVRLEGPHIQVVQDILGPKLGGFELVEDPQGGNPVVRVQEGEATGPSVRISAQGIAIGGAEGAENPAARFRSDNDWMIYNVLATDESLVAFKELSDSGLFSRLSVRGGTIDMHDSVYGLYKRLEDVRFDLAPTATGRAVQGEFGATLAGRKISGSVRRAPNEDGTIDFSARVDNIDFASLLSFLDDPDSVIAVRGAGDFDFNATLSVDRETVTEGSLDIDLTGAQLRVQDDLFPIVTQNVHVDWTPSEARYEFEDAFVGLGKSKGRVSGVLVMGVDQSYGPTVSLSITGRDVVLQPNDMLTPSEPFEEITFTGWSAPLYGALGIDSMAAHKPGVVVTVSGRADFLRSGMGFDVTLGGAGASADDFKRLWPYFIVPGARDWFVTNVAQGEVESSDMRFKFPVGTVGAKDEDKPVPPGAINIDLKASGIRFTPLPTMEAVDVKGVASIEVRDNVTTLGVPGGAVETAAGPVDVENGVLIIDTGGSDYNVFELSGRVRSSFGGLVALAREHFPDTLVDIEKSIGVDALEGNIAGSVLATLTVGRDDVLRHIDYAANGAVADFASREPIEGYTVDEGQLTFSVTNGAYNFNGDAQFNGVDAAISVAGDLESDPNILVSSELTIAQIAELGVDVTDYLDGSVRFAARPLPDGSLQIAADLGKAAVNVVDLGIGKAAEVPGDLTLSVRDENGQMSVDDVHLSFADVDIRGAMVVDPVDGLLSADFPQFKLSPGDDATLSVDRTDDGVSLALKGTQLDLKPMLKRHFSLTEASTGGPQSTQFGNEIVLDIELSRAVGFYSTTAYNFDADLLLEGRDLRHVSLQAQFGEGSSVSIATNPNREGRTMSVAFNDLGTLLRYLNVYSRIAGGRGSLALERDVANNLDRGNLLVRDFSIVDEARVAEILGNHADSRELIANGNQLSFNAGKVDFIRRDDRIEVVDAVLDGDTTGGTMRGFIYTKARQYDLTGTYIPLFALNNIFQRLPIIGEILGGRQGEGLVGVTFAIRGSLDDPNFIINPASILLPGAFRALMEFHATEAAPAEPPASQDTNQVR